MPFLCSPLKAENESERQNQAPLLPKTQQKLQTWIQDCGFVLLPSQEESPGLILAPAQLATPPY